MKYRTSKNSRNMSQSKSLADVFGDLAPDPSQTPNFAEIVRAGVRRRRYRLAMTAAAFVTLIAASAMVLPTILGEDDPPKGFEVATDPVESEQGPGHYDNPSKGISLDYPSGWHLSDQGLSDLSSPEELVVLSTIVPVKGGTCAPEDAIKALGTEDALLLLVEYGDEAGTFKNRPDSFSQESFGEATMLECFPRPTLSISFMDNGRFFQAFIVWGDEISDETKTETEQILDSLRIAPTSTS